MSFLAFHLCHKKTKWDRNKLITCFLFFFGDILQWGQTLMSPCLQRPGWLCWTAASTQCSHLESLIKHGNLIYSNTALISTHQFSTWATCLTFIITWLTESPAVSYTAQPHTSEELPTRWPGCSDTQSAHFTTCRRLSSSKTETACKDGRSLRDVTQPWEVYSQRHLEFTW